VSFKRWKGRTRRFRGERRCGSWRLFAGGESRTVESQVRPVLVAGGAAGPERTFSTVTGPGLEHGIRGVRAVGGVKCP